MNSEDIRHNIESKDTEGLIRILANEKEYTQEAVEIAKIEIRERNVDPEWFKRTFNELKLEYDEIERKANAELTRIEKGVLILFPFVFVFLEPLITTFVPGLKGSKQFHENGYKTKSSQVFNCVVLGGIFWLFIGFVWSLRFYLRK